MNRNPQPSLNNYNKVNGSFDSIEKSNSQFDSASYDLYETQTQRTGMSSDGEESFGLPISRHPMGRPRPVPSSMIGLPPPPPSHVRSVRADVQPKPFDLTFQNQNFRETPSTGSVGVGNEYWDAGPHLQSNGHGVKYKNTNPTNEFLRTASMGTESTFPLQPSNDNVSEVSSNFSPISLRPYPAAANRGQELPHFSKSDDHIQSDTTPFSQPRVRDPIPGYSATPTRNYRSRDDDFLQASQSHPILDQQEPFPSEVISFPPAPTRPETELRHPPTNRVKETSLDDLDRTTELDYELDETVRPISTYLETNMDEDRGYLPPLRGAQSQYIPSHASRSQQQNDPFRDRESDFKALSSRSKSMPLETEM